MSEAWRIEDGTYGPRMVMTGPWSADALRAATSLPIKELELNDAKGWEGDGSGLDFLKGLAGLEALELTDWSEDPDVEAVHGVTSLRRLKINTLCKSELRFSQFPQLEECDLEWRPRAKSLFEHRGLRDLFINRYPGQDLRAFSGMVSLELLGLAGPRIKTLEGIGTLQRLTHVDIKGARGLRSLEGIEHLTRLSHLSVRGSRKLSDLRPIGALTQLRTLDVSEGGEIQSFAPLAGLQQLESLLFYGSTNVVDGDLSPLQGLPRLESVRFVDRPHYSLTEEELLASLRSRRA